MNVYDFDGTIYDGDCTVDFYKYCLKSCPKVLIYVCNAITGLLLYKLGIYSKTAFKERFFSFLHCIPDVSGIVSEFWIIHDDKIKSWYLAQKHETDIVISASPEFLLAPICHKLGVRLIGSCVDASTGKFNGLNCHGEEKVKRLSKVTEISLIKAFYSDSMSDSPLARVIENSFLVRGNDLKPWRNYKLPALSRLKISCKPVLEKMLKKEVQNELH